MAGGPEQSEQEWSRDISTIETLERQAAEQINLEFGQALVDESGRIMAAPYSHERGGPVPANIVARDEAMVAGNEESWAGVLDPDPLVMRSLGVDPTGMTREHMTAAMREHLPQLQEQRRLRDGAVAETIALVGLNRAFQGELMTVKTNAADDERGVDLMMIDRRTGQPFGFLDIVTDDEGGERAAEKQAKVQTRNEQGGSSIRYGLALAEGQMVRASLEHVPTFAFQIPHDRLNEWLQELSQTDGAPDELSELVVASIKRQANVYARDRKIPVKVREQIKALQTSTIPRLKSLLAEPEQEAA